MQLFTFAAAAIALASSVSTSLVEPQHHPAGELFVRRHNKRAPVPLYQGGDAQLEELMRRDPNWGEPVVHHTHAKRWCGSLEDAMPKRDGLLKRQQVTTSPGTNTPYPTPGDVPPSSSLPQAWVDKYNSAKSAGLIPDIPVSKENAAGLVDYPAGADLTKTCNWSIQKCTDGDIAAAPDNSVALGVDDGPTPNGTVPYMKILEDEQISVTHFLIGSAIYWNMDIMKQLANTKPQQHFGVHTWSHTLQSTKTDLQVLGDLGWTMQIIYDATGYIPMYWRPPQGDVDARVRAIARHVLGMQNVMWDRDADDWCLRQDKGTAQVSGCPEAAPNLNFVKDAETGWAKKTNNTGWISLNHETSNQGSEAFKAMVQAIKQNDWNFAGAVAELQGLPWYINAYAKGDQPTKQDNILPTKNLINVTNPSAAKGSDDAPKLGDWSKQASTSSSNLGAQASGGSTSGGVFDVKSVSSALAMLGTVMAALALLI